jgi:hypothetical protein
MIMKLLLAILLATLCAATGHGQTLKSLMYNTSNRQVAVSTNVIFNSGLEIGGAGLGVNLIRGEGGFDIDLTSGGVSDGTNQLFGFGGSWYVPVEFYENITMRGAIIFTTNNTNGAAATRANLGLGATNVVQFARVTTSFIQSATTNAYIELDDDSFIIEAAQLEVRTPINFLGTNVAATTRANLELGATNTPAFRGLTSDGNIVITNQTATNNGILFVYRTNNEPFLGLANLIASNNTTISNETLFRVGTAEATNRSAQFGFRSTNTNGNGVAVFSVFGYNALAMIGPSARSATNTNAIEADIYSINPTNKVATLIDTNTGATLMHRPVGFTTNASTPSSTNTIVGWIQFFVGTNSVRVPYYQ